MLELKKIDPFSFAKMQSIIMLIIGFISQIILFFVQQMLLNLMSSTYYPYKPPTPINWIIQIGVIPLVYMIIGFLASLFVAFLYNFYASKMGGIKVDIIPEQNTK